MDPYSHVAMWQRECKNKERKVRGGRQDVQDKMASGASRTFLAASVAVSILPWTAPAHYETVRTPLVHPAWLSSLQFVYISLPPPTSTYTRGCL